MMKIFEVNDEIKSYTYPILKILICAVIITIIYNRNKIFSITSILGNLIITALVFGLLLGCILCIYISVIEITELHDRRIDEKRNFEGLNTKKYSIDDILKLIEENDIIEIEIKTSQEIIKIGSSSVNNWSENIFYDKLYYCGDKEYESIEELKTAVIFYGDNEELQVVSIDGIAE